MILLGYLTFRVGKDHQIITPTNEGAYKRNGELTELYPKFNAFIYSLETFVPLLNLGISDNWIANANHGAELPRLHKLLLPLSKLTLEVRYGVDGAKAHIRKLAPIKVGSLLRCYYWFHVIAGWVLTTLWVGGFTGLIKS